MPSYAVKTKHEEALWEEAKEIVKDQYGEYIWPIVMTIYKNKKNKYPKSKTANLSKRALGLNVTLYGPADKEQTKRRWEQHQYLIDQGVNEDVAIAKVLGHDLLGDISTKVVNNCCSHENEDYVETYKITSKQLWKLLSPSQRKEKDWFFYADQIYGDPAVRVRQTHKMSLLVMRQLIEKMGGEILSAKKG